MYQGYEKEHSKFIAFQEQIKIEAAKQQAKNEAIVKQHDIVNEGIKNGYEARIAAVGNFYAPSVQHPNPGGSSLPPVSIASPRVIKIASDPEFVGRCAETTVQLVSLQDWVKKQMEIK